MSEKVPHQTETQEPSFIDRAHKLVDHRQMQAETVAILSSDDVEVAASLQGYLQTKYDLEGRTADGRRRTDEEREDSPGVLATKQAHIKSLDLLPDGTLSPEGKDIVSNFRQITQELVTHVGINGEVVGFPWSASDREDMQVAKYKKLAEHLQKQPVSAEADEVGKTSVEDHDFTEKELKVKSRLDAMLKNEDELALDAEQSGKVPVRKVKPILEALNDMAEGDGKFMLSFIENLAGRVERLAKTKYKSEEQFATAQAAAEVFATNLSKADKQALEAAIEKDVQGQIKMSETIGGGAFKGSHMRSDPEAIFRNFMADYLTRK